MTDRAVRPRMYARALAAVALAAVALGAPGCGKKAESKTPAGGTAAAPAPKPAPGAPNAAAPAPAGISAAIATLSRETAEKSVASLRKLAETSFDPAAFTPYLDPSQSSLTSKFIGPTLVYYARVADLRRAAEERFGPTGAEQAAAAAGSIYQIDLANGLREIFQADRFAEVRRAGPNAYVMSNGKDGQPMGDAICLRENQGEWLLLLATGDKPWDEKKLSNYAAIIGGPMQSASGNVSKTIANLAQRTRAGEFKKVEDLLAEIQKIGKT